MLVLVLYGGDPFRGLEPIFFLLTSLNPELEVG